MSVPDTHSGVNSGSRADSRFASNYGVTLVPATKQVISNPFRISVSNARKSEKHMVNRMQTIKVFWMRRAAQCGSAFFAFCVLTCNAGLAIAQPIQLVLPLVGSFSVPDAAGEAAKGTPAQRIAAAAQIQGIPVQFNAAAMQNVRSGGEVDFTLPSAARYTIVFELAQSHGGDITSWTGYLKDYGKRYRALITAGPEGTFARIETPSGEYRLVPGAEHDFLLDMEAVKPFLPTINLGDDGLVPPVQPRARETKTRGEPSLFTAISGVNTVGLSALTPSPPVVVDLMFVVTTGLANRLGGNLMTRLQSLIANANDTYARSEVAITLRLVHVTVVDYPDTGSNSLALNAITPVSGGGVGVFSNVEALRSTYGADIVAFLRNGQDFGGSGVAWVPVPATSDLMYSVTTGCVLGCELVFIHEVGHNMGNKHDRDTTSWQDGGTTSPSAGLFIYSYGYRYCSSGQLTCDPTRPNGPLPACTSAGAGGLGPACLTRHDDNFSTIMSYFNPTLYYFSNPNVVCGPLGGATRPCGIIETAPDAANNALSMNINRFNLSAIKSTAIATVPGSIQFTATTFSGAETAGALNLTVSRLGGSSGAISASYATSNGSALAGLDYAQTIGNVSWADGDTANKTISIPIVNDGVVEGAETFNVSLSNPAGAPGLYLGTPSSATAIITEDWPPGGTIPSGMLTPAGSSAAWTVATDQVSEGANSLRSGAVFGNGDLATYFNSDLNLESVFSAGTVAFAYRVSSYQGLGSFEFLVDGTVVFMDTGETGWKSFSYQIGAGTHTLIWRFKNRLPSACNGSWTPPAQGGAACADRVWIDAVVLPLVLASSTIMLGSSSNPSVVGQSVTLTATVSGVSGTPRGYVVFRDGGSVIAGCAAVPVSNGTAQCITSSLLEGTHSITGQYSGNVTYSSSTSNTFTQTANTSVFPLVAIAILLL